MRSRSLTVWMWSEALELLERAERMQRQCFQLSAQRDASPTWEPPVDMFETEREFIVLAALPGVADADLHITLEGAVLSVRGLRAMPQFGAHARVERVEIPYGRFERRLELPAPQLRLAQRQLQDGCLVLTLQKEVASP